jgi:hypothetical protein
MQPDRLIDASIKIWQVPYLVPRRIRPREALSLLGFDEFFVELVQRGWVCEKVVEDSLHDDCGRI